MRRAWQSGSAWRGVLFLLLALMVVNAITVCATPVAAQPVHPCCPVRTHSTSGHCGKLGCSMSDPVTRPGSYTSADPGTGSAVEISSVSPVPTFSAAPIAARLVASSELYVTFRQLLI